MSYQQHLNDTVEKIIDAAIEAGMYNNGWTGDVHTGFKSGKGYHISPPGHPRSAGGQVTDPSGDPYELTDGVDPGPDVYGKWEREIRAAFQDWDTIPDPKDYTAPVDAIADAAWQISVVTEGEKIEDTGNPGLESLDYLRDKTVQMESAIISRFSELYAYPLPAAMHGQYEMVALAALLVAAEQKLWERARHDITDIAEKGLTAMRSAHYQAEPADVSAILSTVGTVAGIAAVFPTPAKPILSGAGTVLSGLGTLMKPGDEPSKPELPFGADTPEKCLENIVEGIKRLNLSIIEEEQDTDSKIDKALGTVTERPGAFDLPSPDLLEQSESRIAQEIRHDQTDIRHICTVTLPRLAGFLSTSAKTFDSGRTPNAWLRQGLIGLSQYGPYENWAKLISEAELRISDTSYELLQAATRLQGATGEVVQADEQSENDMRRQRNEVREDLDYVPPGAERYGNAGHSLPAWALP